jgi:hypothetical protein
VNRPAFFAKPELARVGVSLAAELSANGLLFIRALNTNVIATCIPALSQEVIWELILPRYRVAHMYPASDAAIHMLRARVVFEEQIEISPAC